MKNFYGTKAVLCLAVAFALVAFVPVCQAKSASKTEKHAEKMQKKLAHYKSGTLLHLQFNDDTECLGTVNTLSEESFTFNNTETNAKEAYNYSDVSEVGKGKQFIGQGSVTKHRVPFGKSSAR